MKQRGYATVFWKPDHHVNGIDNVVESADFTFTAPDEVYKQIAALRNERDVFLGVDRTAVLSGQLSELRLRLEETGARPVTTALVDILFEAVDEDVPYGPLDTFLKFDLELSTRALFPAVDPVFSTSTMLEGSMLEAAHLAIQQRARRTMRRYRELRSLVNVRGLDMLAPADALSYRRGERLEAFLTQPFHVTEAFTQKPGEWLPLQDTLDGARRILDGAADDLAVQDLLYIGRLTFED
jgi:F-type H+-transporting ATPase subunit beta